MSVKWHKEYATGVTEIDLQHQQLFSHLDSLLDAIESGKGQKVLSDLYSFLDSYTREHFAAEERLQKKFHYPQMTLHCNEHQVFLKSLDSMKTRIATDGPSDALVKLTRNTLVNWMINHICSTDKHLGDFVKLHRNAEWESWLRTQF